MLWNFVPNNIGMNTFPKGNDLTVKWSIRYSDGSAFPLANYAYELCYSYGRGINVVQDTAVISVKDNVLTWVFAGKEQAFKGNYSLTLRLYQNGKVVATVSKNNAFTLDSTKYDGPCDIDLVSYCDNIHPVLGISLLRQIEELQSRTAELEARVTILEEVTKNI